MCGHFASTICPRGILGANYPALFSEHPPDCHLVQLARGFCLFPSVSSFCQAERLLEGFLLAFVAFAVFLMRVFPAFIGNEDSTLFPLIITSC